MKAKLGKRTVTINASEKPFGVEEGHYSDIVFFTELSMNETPRTSKVAMVKLQELDAALESSGQKRSSKATSPPPMIVKVR